MSRPLRFLVLAVILTAIASAATLTPPLASRHASFGRGTPVVLLHGLGSRREHWLPTARILARHHRVELVDLPGHGTSGMPEPFSLARATAALDAALAEISSEPVILVGHSLGGLVAAAEAVENPSRIRGLVLVETALRPQLPASERAAWLERLERDTRAVVDEAYRSFGRDSAQGERLAREVATLDPAMMRRWIRLAWTTDLSGTARGIHVPVLAVLSDRSWTTGEPWRDAAAALGYAGIPRLRGARLAGTGHFVMLDRPGDLAALLRGFAADPGGERTAVR